MVYNSTNILIIEIKKFYNYIKAWCCDHNNNDFNSPLLYNNDFDSPLLQLQTLDNFAKPNDIYSENLFSNECLCHAKSSDHHKDDSVSTFVEHVKYFDFVDDILEDCENDIPDSLLLNGYPIHLDQFDINNSTIGAVNTHDDSDDFKISEYNNYELDNMVLNYTLPSAIADYTSHNYTNPSYTSHSYTSHSYNSYYTDANGSFSL